MSDATDSKSSKLRVINDDPRGPLVQVVVAWLRFQNRFERRTSEVLAKHGLTRSQFDVLATLWHGEGICQQELAERLLVTKGNVVGLIDRVGAAGWVERRPDPDDRRAHRLYLTKKGRDIVAKAFPSIVALNQIIFGALNEAELKTLKSLVDRLEDACQKST